MKKLNKKQKDYLKKSLLKGLNISCYVITGLALTLGILLGINSCSKGDKNVVSTTPVVNEVLQHKDLINNTELDIASTYTDVNGYYEYSELLGGKDFCLTNYDYNSIGSHFFDNLTEGDILVSCRSENGVALPLFNMYGVASVDSGHESVEFDDNYYMIEFVGLTSGLPDLRFYYSDLSGSDLISFAHYDSGHVELYLHFNSFGQELLYNSDYSSSIVNLYSDVWSSDTSVPHGLYYDFLGYFIDEYDLPSREQINVNASYNMAGYISPFSVVNKDYKSGIMLYHEKAYTGFTESYPFLVRFDRDLPRYIKIFDGSFTCDNVEYNSIIIEFDVIHAKDLTTNYYFYIFKRVYFRNNNGSTQDVIITHNNINTFKVLPGISEQVAQGLTWNFVDSKYRSIFINYAYVDYSLINFWSLNNNNPTEYLDYLVSNSGNANNTLADATNSPTSVPVYDDVPTSYAFGSVFGLISMAFNSLVEFFSVDILPGVSLGTLFFIPLVVMIVIFIVWLIKR